LIEPQSILPRETVRLAALGFLADGPRSYSSLASEVRNFTSRYVGPTLELMTSSIEVLRQEGLITLIDPMSGPGPDALLELSGSGKNLLISILSTGLQPPINDIARLVLALKFRFLHLLSSDMQRDQLNNIIEASKTDLTRLLDLKSKHNHDPGFLSEWLEHDIGQIEERLSWLTDFINTLEATKI
jgi:hypothetical protein